jgi:hypothetical protein
MNSPHPPYTFSSSPLSSSPLPSSSPPTEFVTPLSPPVPEIGKARLEPHSPKLRELDKIYERSEHPLLDGFRFIGAGGVGNPWPKEKREKRGEEGELDEDDDAIGPMVEDMNDGLEVRTKKAMRVLENHIKDRMPFVRLSSQRLQAVMGVRNELAFSLLPFSSSSNPLIFIHLSDEWCEFSDD